MDESRKLSTPAGFTQQYLPGSVDWVDWAEGGLPQIRNPQSPPTRSLMSHTYHVPHSNSLLCQVAKGLVFGR